MRSSTLRDPAAAPAPALSATHRRLTTAVPDPMLAMLSSRRILWRRRRGSQHSPRRRPPHGTTLPASLPPSRVGVHQALVLPPWRSLVARIPPLPDNSGLLAAVSDLQRRYFGGRRRRRRRRAALPLPPRPAAAHSARIAGEMPKAFVILDDVVQHTLTNLHSIHKSLLFWQAKAEGTNSQKVYFMIFERGPRAFVDTTYQTLTRLGSNERPVQYILHSASDMVSIKLAALTSMQHCLAAFLAEIHSEVDKCREGLTANSDKSLHTLFIVLNTTFSKLEVSLRNAGKGQDELSTYDGNSYELFGKLPEVDVESPEWTEALSTDGISLIYQNLQKLDSFLSSQVQFWSICCALLGKWIYFNRNELVMPGKDGGYYERCNEEVRDRSSCKLKQKTTHNIISGSSNNCLAILRHQMQVVLYYHCYIVACENLYTRTQVLYYYSHYTL